jgi:hypothetical protein
MQKVQFSYLGYVAWQILGIVGFHIEAIESFQYYKYLHKPSMFLVRYREFWDAYKHVQKLVKQCSCW